MLDGETGLRRTLALATLAALAAGCGSGAATERGVALIEGHTISTAALQRNLAYAASFYAWAYGNPGAKGNSCTVASRSDACVVMRRQVLARLLEEQLVVGYAAAHHISLSAADLQVVHQ